MSEGSGRVAIALDVRLLIGGQEAGENSGGWEITSHSRDFKQDGGFTAPAHTAVKNAPLLKPGDRVVWVAGKHLAEIRRKVWRRKKRKGWPDSRHPTARKKIPTCSFVSLDYRDLPARGCSHVF